MQWQDIAVIRDVPCR